MALARSSSALHWLYGKKAVSSLDLWSEEADYLDRLRTAWNQTIEGEGGHCVCCGKWGKVYKIKLSQHLALCLKWIIDHSTPSEPWVDVQNQAPRWMLKSKTQITDHTQRLLEPLIFFSFFMLNMNLTAQPLPSVTWPLHKLMFIPPLPEPSLLSMDQDTEVLMKQF